MIPPASRLACTAFALLAGAVLAWPAAAAPADPTQARGVRTLILVRHGVYDEDDPRDPEVGRGLTPQGREQARLTAARLAASPLEIAALHASTMTRARETAAVLGDSLKLAPRLSPDLRECTPPSERADIMARQRPGETDSCRMALERVVARYFRPSPERDSTEVLVCHGNVIRYLTCRALGVDAAIWLRMTIANCSLTTIRVRSDGSMLLVGFSDVGHLPPALRTLPGPRSPGPSTEKPSR